MATPIKGFKPDGKLPDVPKAEVVDLIKSTAATKDDLERVKPTPEAIAQAQGYWIVQSSTPPDTSTMYGVPVLWVDTRSKESWKPTAPTLDSASGKVTIPSDDGATYMVNGETKPAGVYQLALKESWGVTAAPKSGYTLVAPTAWSLTYSGVSSLSKLKAASKADGATNLLSLAGASPVADEGSAPLTWSAGSALISEGYGSSGDKVTTDPVANVFTHNAESWSLEFVVEPLGVAGQHTYASNQQMLVRDDRYLAVDVTYQKKLTVRTGDYVDGATKTNTVIATTLVEKSPTHVAVTFDGSTVTVYVNGVAAGSGVGYKRTYAVAANSPYLVNAAYSKIGNFAFYRNKVLTASQVAAHASLVGKG